MGGAGLISATVNVTSSIAQDVYQSFKNKKLSELNEQMILVRKIFDQYNLISALHSYKSQKDLTFKNVLPPLKLLDDLECKKLFEDLKNINFKKAA